MYGRLSRSRPLYALDHAYRMGTASAGDRGGWSPLLGSTSNRTTPPSHQTLVSLMLIRDFYFEDARRREKETHMWCIFLCPTQELVYQQGKCAQMFTGVRCGESTLS